MSSCSSNLYENDVLCGERPQTRNPPTIEDIMRCCPRGLSKRRNSFSVCAVRLTELAEIRIVSRFGLTV